MVKTNTKHQNSSTHTSMTKFVYFIVYIFVADAASTAHDDTAVVAEAEINSLDGSTTTTVVNNNSNNSSWNILMKQICSQWRSMKTKNLIRGLSLSTLEWVRPQS
mmetsp:Transcript_24944/g.59272  ORF Transcript_24944/g.59272 Transcript_24944/m.59272 type:complete len:105 (-) Transcript_24944:2544-2858(-)